MVKSKYDDTVAALQVIGCIINNPTLLDDAGTYFFRAEDFTSELHKVVFTAIGLVYANGGTVITPKAIDDTLSLYPEAYATYKGSRGNEWFVRASQECEPENFDLYYSRLKKMTLLREYDKLGIDMSWFYDPDELDSSKRQRQMARFDATSIGDISSLVEDRLLFVRSSYVDNASDETVCAGEGIFKTLEKLKQEPEFGAPLYGPYVNTVVRGARLTKFYLRSAPTGVGKAIPNDTLIPTPIGYRKVGDIKPGDSIFGQDGKPTTVLCIHPQSHKKEIWNVYFSDGRVAQCCGEHLWEYGYETPNGYEYAVDDTATILNKASKLKNAFNDDDGKGYRFHIKLNGPVEYPERKYYLHPYIMGTFIGKHADCDKDLYFSSEDRDTPELGTKDSFHPLEMEESFKEYPELLKVKSQDKFIPKEYLLGSVPQRMSLLQGLMDTDGFIDKDGRTIFSTVSAKLRDDFIELCRSLGFIATYSTDSCEKYMASKCYNVHIQTGKEAKASLFTTKSKEEQARCLNNNCEKSEHEGQLAIVNIEKTAQLAEMTCFTVDNESHLFLMNDFIVTHNTRMMIADVCNFACDEIYDTRQNKWVPNGPALPTLYISTELELQEVQTMCIAFLSGVNEEHILLSHYDFGEEERVMYACKVLSRSKLYVDIICDFSLRDIENSIKRNHREHKVMYVGFDYIMTTMKILEEITSRAGGVALREDNILFMMSVRLKDLANELGIFILSSTQLNASFKTDPVPDQNLLRGAKSVADKIDAGFIALDVTEEDLEKIAPLLSENPVVPNVKLSVYKNRRGSYNRVFLWMYADKGTCRYETLYATTFQYQPIKIDEIKPDFIYEEEENTDGFDF